MTRNQFLTRHEISSSGKARSISAVTPSGLDFPFLCFPRHFQTMLEEIAISWKPFFCACHTPECAHFSPSTAARAQPEQ